MADSKISALTDGNPAQSGDEIPIARGGANYKITAGSIASLGGDVDGPASSVDNQIALFDSTTGKLIKAATTTGVLKASSGVIAAAVASTDYAPATTGTNAQLLANNGSGGFSNVTVGSNLTLSAGTLSAAGGLSWQSVQTTGFTAVAGNAYPCNTTSAAFTVTLPASPAAGNVITLTDYAGTFATNNLTVNPNGLKIQGETTNQKIAANGNSVTLVYVDSTRGWIAYSAVTATPFYTPPATSIDYAVVAGGGGGGASIGGGGGGGGFRTGASVSVSSTPSLTVTVGTGGAAGSAGRGGNGTDSSISGTSFTTVTSTGGGGGGYNTAGVGTGLTGGSGGGGAGDGVYAGGAGNTPSTSPSQGNTGGSGTGGGGTYSGGGGGGGAGGTGSNGSGAGGNGGAGAQWPTSSGVFYAGGGGGAGGYTGPGGTGGSGGGGNAGSAGLNGKGGGGGANAKGGDGVVIIRYADTFRAATTTGSPTVSVSGGYRTYTFTGNGSITF